MNELIAKLDSSSSMEYKIDDEIHIWPLVRYVLLAAIIDIDMVVMKKQKVSIFRRMLNLIIGLKDFKVRRRNIIFMTTTLLNREVDGKYKNILDDYYVDVFPDDSYVYEGLAPTTYKSVKNRYNRSTSTLFFYIEIVIMILSKISRNKKNEGIEQFVEYLEREKVEKKAIERIEPILSQFNRDIKVRKFLYKYFFKIIKPKLLFINCGFYGGHQAVVINEAKKLGILVAEIQHGDISHTHIAYKYYNDIEEYKQYQPTYLMVFGDEYIDRHNCAKKISVGHPHLEYKKNHTNGVVLENSYLFISQWVVVDELIDLAVSLSKHKGTVINFRLHPLDVLNQNQYDLLNQNNIEISSAKDGKDLYDEFAIYENVVGCFSTSLIEATAFNKKVYILRHKLSIRDHFDEVGIMVDNADEIIVNNKTIVAKNIYTSSFESKYTEFIVSLNILTNNPKKHGEE